MGVAIGDYDNDGNANLFVTNHGRNILNDNNGDRNFTDVTKKAGVAGGGWGVSAGFFDFDNDDHLDFFVTRYMEWDMCHNECALESGVGLFADGKPLSGMDTVFQDYDNDGRPDIHVTELPREIYGHHHNDGGGLYDRSLHYLETPPLALNHNGRFERTESGITTPAAGRGLAFGDLNNDGWLDAVVTVLGGHALILMNRSLKRHWLSINFRGTPSSRDGLGARVRVNGQTRFASTEGSYLSASDKRVHFALGESNTALIEVSWPSGTRQTLKDVPADQFLEIHELEHL